jgi:ribosomal protein S18 acetylase RimI-like enzyme
MFQLSNCTREQFKTAISDARDDNFAKTFIAKADMQKQWEHCVGAFDDGVLLGAIITTISKRNPPVANLQLLHTFAAHRGKGVGRILCDDALKSVRTKGAKYFRVSSEKTAVEFYKRIGIKFLGKQKSGCQLSIFKIGGDQFSSGIYDIDDSVIFNAVNKKGKGGCVEIFPFEEKN